MSDYNPPEEFVQLLLTVTDGELNDEQRERLNEIINSDADARRYYVKHMSVHGMLQWRHGNIPALDVPLAELDDDFTPSRNILGWAVSLVVAASLLIGTGYVFYVFYPHEKKVQVARLVDDIDMEWQDGARYESGDELSHGRHTLLSGGTRIEFASGTVIVIQGPIEFSIDSDNSLKLYSGAMRAYVPPKAKGFTVKALHVKVVDLGTEFGVSVDSKHQEVHVHVFLGKVQVNDEYFIPKGKAYGFGHKGTKWDENLEQRRFPSKVDVGVVGPSTL